MGKTLGIKCFEYRVKHELNQQEMAALCRVHWLTILHCEQEKPLRRMTAAKIAAVVGKDEKEA